jgi:hypothetical protein
MTDKTVTDRIVMTDNLNTFNDRLMRDLEAQLNEVLRYRSTHANKELRDEENLYTLGNIIPFKIIDAYKRFQAELLRHSLSREEKRLLNQTFFKKIKAVRENFQYRFLREPQLQRELVSI